jgi:hypothetical protein
MTILNDNNDYMIEFKKDIVPKGTFPQERVRVPSAPTTSNGTDLLSRFEKTFSVKIIDPYITAEGYFRIDTTGGKFKATANFQLTATITNGWAVTLEAKFSAEATACDRAVIKASVSLNLILELGSNKHMCLPSTYTHYRGGRSNSMSPGDTSVNLVQCVFDMFGHTGLMDDMCVKPDECNGWGGCTPGTVGPETCTCKRGWGSASACTYSNCWFSSAGFCNRFKGAIAEKYLRVTIMDIDAAGYTFPGTSTVVPSSTTKSLLNVLGIFPFYDKEQHFIGTNRNHDARQHGNRMLSSHANFQAEACGQCYRTLPGCSGFSDCAGFEFTHDQQQL